MKPKTPKSISSGHENLCSELSTIMNLYPNSANKLQPLSKVMLNHFQKEEKYALPPLGLVLALSQGNWQLDENIAVDMSRTLNLKFEELRNDHEKIADIIKNLKNSLEYESIYEFKRFITSLEVHMDLEDQVLYPTAILIANYFKKIKNGI